MQAEQWICSKICGFAIGMAVMVTPLLNTGCRPGLGFDKERYVRCVQSGLKKIPEARQIEETFGDADHLITYYGGRTDNDWQTEVFFGNRYVLTLEIPISLSTQLDSIEELRGEPRFYLVEADQVTVNQDGTVSTRFNPNAEFTFNREMWKKIYAAKGDLSVAGVKINTRPVPNFDKYKEATRRDRIQLPK